MRVGKGDSGAGGSAQTAQQLLSSCLTARVWQGLESPSICALPGQCCQSPVCRLVLGGLAQIQRVTRLNKEIIALLVQSDVPPPPSVSRLILQRSEVALHSRTAWGC